MKKDQRLKRAIRAFTVDAGAVGAPRSNGPAEAAFSRLADALLALPDPEGQRIAGLASAYLAADVERLRELRQAADEFFREDFRRPELLDVRLSPLERFWTWLACTLGRALERAGLVEPTCYCYYGSFPGGDPRDFRPDPENAAAELQEHRGLCAAWDAGQKDRPDISLGLGTVLCEHHRRVPTPPPQLLVARRRLLAWFSEELG